MTGVQTCALPISEHEESLSVWWLGVGGEHSVMGHSVDLTGKRILTRIKWSGAEESGTHQESRGR